MRYSQTLFFLLILLFFSTSTNSSPSTPPKPKPKSHNYQSIIQEAFQAPYEMHKTNLQTYIEQAVYSIQQIYNYFIGSKVKSFSLVKTYYELLGGDYLDHKGMAEPPEEEEDGIESYFFEEDASGVGALRNLYVDEYDEDNQKEYGEVHGHGHCGHGEPIKILQRLWKCQSGDWSKSYTFDPREYFDDVQCEVDEKIYHKCYCPQDSLGISCRELNPLECHIKQVSPDQDCHHPDTEEFVYSYAIPEVKPCASYSIGDDVIMGFNVTCEFKLPLEPEGMRFKLEKNEELISEIPTLQYVYEDENLKISNRKRKQVVIKFREFHNMTKYLQVLYEPKYSHLLSKPSFNIQFQLTDSNLRYSSYGRFYYEYGIKNDRYLASGFGNLDNTDYAEPQKTIVGLLLWEFVLIIVAFIMLCCLAGCCYCRWKEAKEAQEQGEYQNLIEMINFDRSEFINNLSTRDDDTILDDSPR